MKGIQGAGLDQVTGLPKVGPRQFWRVMHYSSADVYGDGYYVCLMEFQPTSWRPERAVEIANRVVQLTADEPRSAENIREVAEAILEERRRDQVVKGMLGDYPPKRL